jgi:hypothetical protein
MNLSESLFSQLSKLDVSKYIEKKGKFNYLSWSYALHTLLEYAPETTWEIVRHNGMPYIKTDLGYFVEVAVVFEGKRTSFVHPVLNGFNKPIEKPTTFDINTATMRCLTKCIAMSSGIGIHIYQGEDMPIDLDDEPKQPVRKGTTKTPVEQEPPHEHLAVEKKITPEQIFLIEQLAYDIGELRKVDPHKILQSAIGDSSVILSDFDEITGNAIMNKLVGWKTQAEEKAKVK